MVPSLLVRTASENAGRMTAAAGWRPLPTTQVAIVDEFTLRLSLRPSPSKLWTAGPHRGHIQATNDRIAAEDNGRQRAESSQLISPIGPGVAGPRDPPKLSDREEVTGSNPVAPTILALSRGVVDWHVPGDERDRRRGRFSGLRALPCSTYGGLLAGLSFRTHPAPTQTSTSRMRWSR